MPAYIHLKPAQLFLLFTLSSCSEVGPYSGTDLAPPPLSDMFAPDLAAEREDMANSQPLDMPRPCFPKTRERVCADACGAQEDGCGGVVECAPCACESGAPIKPTCGPCNLGSSSCDEQDNFSCILPAHPFIDTMDCTTDVVYVSNTSSIPSPDGSKNAPWPSFNDALEDAAQKGAKLIVAMNTAVYEEETLTLRSGTSIVGGYNLEWIYQEQEKTHIFIHNSEEKNDLVGLEAHGILTPTLVSNLTIETNDNTGNGNNYGIQASTANQLTLDNLKVIAGDGGTGATGIPAKKEIGFRGRDGADGLPGQSEPGQTNASYDCTPPLPIPLGPGFHFTCEDADSYGGSGGFGGCTNTPPTNGKSSKKNVRGGDAGSTSSPRGEPGRDAQSWDRDRWGEPGSKGTPIHTVVAGQLVSLGVGSDGTPGTSGKGGGGGGGAILNSSPYTSGPSGGNGGNGGCGGYGGGGGKPGGSSIGIFIADTFGLEIRGNTTIQASNGGKGGQGANGGLGGSGGSGGRGSNEACSVTTPDPTSPYARNFDNCQTLTYGSGNGGNGADGTPGGPGGGGAGGDSIGIYCHASRISLPPATVAKAGEAGQGGLGGAYPVPDEPVMGEQGEPGLANDIIGCN